MRMCRRVLLRKRSNLASCERQYGQINLTLGAPVIRKKKMSLFGKGLKRTATPGAEDEAAPKLGKRAPVLLMNLDLDKIEFGTKVEKGNQGDQFVRCTYMGGRLEIAIEALPSFCRAPFAAGPAKTSDGNQLGTAWGMAVEITPAQYDKWVAFEALVIKKLAPMRNELFPAEAKKKGKAGMSEDAFADKYNSKLTPPNVEKGYAPTLRIFIEHDETRQMPKIQLMHLLDGNMCTRPVKGTVHDLVAKAAVVPVISLVRGIYAGQTGLGCKFAGTAIDILTNLQVTNAPEVDYSGVTFVDAETPSSSAPVGGGDAESAPPSPSPAGDSPAFDELNPKPAGF